MSKKRDTFDRATEEALKDDANLKKVFLLLEKSLDEGNPKAAYALATWYYFGKYVKKDIKKAIKLMREAAKNNVQKPYMIWVFLMNEALVLRKTLE